MTALVPITYGMIIVFTELLLIYYFFIDDALLI